VGIKGRLSALVSRSPDLSVAQTMDLLSATAKKYGAGLTQEQVEEELRGQGLRPKDATLMAQTARTQFEADLRRRVVLPPSARSDVNYYFILGVTPRARADRIHRNYERLAAEVDQYRRESELEEKAWHRLSVLLSDADKVLSDPTTRAAYDLVWRERSHRVTADNPRRDGKRGDWETRDRWQIAELGEMEEQLTTLLNELERAAGSGAGWAAMTAALARAADAYEAKIVDIRTHSHFRPQNLQKFSQEVRHLMNRKESLAEHLRELSGDMSASVQDTLYWTRGMLEEVRVAQRRFELDPALR
jgi:curved DNA-binding protein CbpA